MSGTEQTLPSSFRDPAGYLFLKNGVLCRRINFSYKDEYDFFMRSGLYENLARRSLLINHEEIGKGGHKCKDTYLEIQPTAIPFVSYPYEWCFSQLKDAALLTLDIQREALARGMTLKDASAYNVTFCEGKPIFMDTLSFEIYEEGKPWAGYKQFCQHFLAPLALMSLRDIRLNQLFKVYLDGIPLDLASKLLPKITYCVFSLCIHIHVHAWLERRYSSKLEGSRTLKTVNKRALLGILASLEKGIKRLTWTPEGTEWVDYYRSDRTYTSNAFDEKRRVIADFLDDINPQFVWDAGANTGYFSRIAAERGIDTVSFDVDPACVELNYLEARENKDTKILPLVLDLTNPSAGIGWENRERIAFVNRQKPDLVLGLALIHHLAISNNLPLDRIASFFSNITKYLVIEYVPKSDMMVQNMLAARIDIFPNYTREGFEDAFNKYFVIKRVEELSDSKRIVYLMIRRTNG